MRAADRVTRDGLRDGRILHAVDLAHAHGADIGVEQERHRALDLADSDAALLCLLDHSFIAELSCAVVQESGNPRLLFVHAEVVRKLHGRLGYAE